MEGSGRCRVERTDLICISTGILYYSHCGNSAKDLSEKLVILIPVSLMQWTGFWLGFPTWPSTWKTRQLSRD